jgi:hypothetical protein
MQNGKNNQLNKAKRDKQDEFYTQLTDIEKELRHYKEHLKGKTIFCNCDDPLESNFWKYFYLNFNELELKKLIATHYDPEKPTYKMEYNGVDCVKVDLKENGDFRSPECIELLKAADVIVTNPPFSLFREFVAQLMEYEKKFLIIGSLNAITYKEIFPLLKENKIWVGYNNGYKEYIVPNYYELNSNGCREENGIKYRGMGNTYWFTNLEIKKRCEELILYKKYNDIDYPRYDNYDAINVDKTKDIPCDYFGLMGVPITFIDKYNPNQFEILSDSRYHDGREFADDINIINGKLLYRRILIKRKVQS